MNLLSYTKKLYKKVNFYDKYIKDTNYKSAAQNPFRNKERSNITVIWVQENNKKL